MIALLTIALLVLFFRNSDISDVGRRIREADPLWLGLGLIANMIALLARTERWRTILRPEDPPPFYTTFFATAIGFMSSAILPVRAGDFVRPALIKRRTNIGFSTALGTVVTERILDLLSMLGLLVVYVVWTVIDPTGISQKRMGFIHGTGWIAGALFIVMMSFMFSVYFFKSTVRMFHEALGRIIPKRARGGWMAFFDSFAASMSIVHNRPAFLRVMGMTAVVWIALSSQFYFVMYAVGRPLPFRASYFVTGMTIVGMAFPTPGGVGGFHKACQLVLTGVYGINLNTAVAVAIIFHAVGTAPVVVTGLALFVHERLTWRQLTKLSREAESRAGIEAEMSDDAVVPETRSDNDRKE